MHCQETDLYRHYDAYKNLLYVGISLNTAQRLYQHMRDSKWASEITSIEVEKFRNRQEALDAEVKAIKAEKPLWNVIHNRETKREKGASKAPIKKTTKKSSRPKTQQPKDPFNMASLEAAIEHAILKMRHLRMTSHQVTCEEDVNASTFANIKLELPSFVHDDDLGLDEFMNLASFSPYPRAYVSMMTGYTLIDDRKLDKKVELSLITPGWLRRMLYEDFNLSGRESKEALEDISMLLAEYEREFLQFLTIDSPRALNPQSALLHHGIRIPTAMNDCQKRGIMLTSPTRSILAV